MVIKECILKASEILRASGTQSNVLDARILLCKALGKDEIYLAINPTEEVDEKTETMFFDMVSRRMEGKPIAYITEEKEFMSLNFFVNENVLIPRPDTEHLAELAIEIAKEKQINDIADFCTGSGALAISIGKNCPFASVTGYDISDNALKVAEKNKQKLNAVNVEFKKLDVLKDLEKMKEKFSLVVSNPPYISADEMKTLPRDVDLFEPHLALFGGEDGLDFYKKIINDANCFLKPKGILAFEVGHTQAQDVSKIMEAEFENIKIKKDYAGIDRVVWGIKK